MLTKRVPTYAVLLSVASGIVLTFLFLSKNNSGVTAHEASAAKVVTENTPDNNIKQSRQKGFELINPLLSVNPGKESANLSSLKAKIMNLVDDDKRQGLLSSASVYICTFLNGEWIYLNPEEQYHPGSLMKVPVLMTWLKEAEADPQVLNRKISFAKTENLPTQTFKDRCIKLGQTYTVKELLHYMIAYSDNNATHILNENADLNMLKKIFTDLNSPEPDLHDKNYLTSAIRYSDFFTVLYNSSYLSRKSSEYALLLTECDFKEGLLKQIPPTVKVAHKFGEWGDYRMNIHELHESGIFYLNNKPYLLTIMAKGNTSKELAMELGKISKIVYDHLSVGN